MKHNPLATANASAITFSVLYFFSIVFLAINPDLFSLPPVQVSLGLFVILGMASAVACWGLGYLYALIYNSFLKK